MELDLPSMDATISSNMMKTKDGKISLAIIIMLMVSLLQTQTIKAMILKVGQMMKMSSKKSMVRMQKLNNNFKSSHHIPKYYKK
jgi:hypothetical protein